MNNLTIFMLFWLLVLALEAVWLSINRPPLANDQRKEQNQQIDKFEVFKNVLEIAVLLISLLR